VCECVCVRVRVRVRVRVCTIKKRPSHMVQQNSNNVTVILTPLLLESCRNICYQPACDRFAKGGLSGSSASSPLVTGPLWSRYPVMPS